MANETTGFQERVKKLANDISDFLKKDGEFFESAHYIEQVLVEYNNPSNNGYKYVEYLSECLEEQTLNDQEEKNVTDLIGRIESLTNFLEKLDEAEDLFNNSGFMRYSEKIEFDEYFKEHPQLNKMNRQFYQVDLDNEKIVCFATGVETGYESKEFTVNASDEANEWLKDKTKINKEKLKALLEDGRSMKDILQFSIDQNNEIYKVEDEDFDNANDEIVYIMNLDNGSSSIPKDKRNLSENEITEVLNRSFTKADFLTEADGDTKAARDLFWFVNWQSPNINELKESLEKNELMSEFSFFNSNDDNVDY